MKYLQLIRVKHWIKNLLIFFPIVFSGQLLNKNIFFIVSVGFFIFSLIASVIYILNDLKDLDKDKGHPQKRKRPLTSGAVSKREAIIVMLLLILIVLAVLIIGGDTFPLYYWIYLCCYFIMNVAYSFELKNVPLVDVTILAGGYLIRLFCGGELAGTGVSEWMFLTVISAAFFLGFGKRRNELRQYGNHNRKILEKYTEAFLDKSVQLFLALTIVFYALCCADRNTFVAKEGIRMLWTVPVVILVLLRYSMFLEDGSSDGDPVEVIQKDWWLMGLIAFYGISVMTMIYGGR